MKKVLYLTHAITHYNTSLLEELIKQNESYEYIFYGGNNFQGIRNTDLNYKGIKFFPYKKIEIKKHIFFWFKKLFKYTINEKPSIVVITGIDFHLPQSILIFLFYKIFTDLKLVWWSHGKFKNKSYIGRLARKLLYNNSDAIMLYSNDGINVIKSIGVTKPILVSVGNCLNNIDYGFNILESIEKPKEIFRIVFSGRLTKDKNIPLLIKALFNFNKQINTKWECCIVGDGEEKVNIENLIKILDLSVNIKLLGAKYGNELAPIFKNAHLMVIPSAVGLGIVHAFSYGIPVVTCDKMSSHGPEVELLEPGITGEFYIDNDEIDLCEKIIKWCNKTLREEEIQSNCIRNIFEYGYTPYLVAKKMINTFSQI